MALAAPTKTGRVPVNGIDYYYEIHGQGEPLLLLHGGLGSIDMFGPVLTQLAKTRKVIAVDLQGHGRTPLTDRPFSLEAIGNDMAAIVKQLGYEQVDVMGYYPDEGHGFARAPNRTSFYAVSEAFLSECLGGRFEPVGNDFKGSSITVPKGVEFAPGLKEALAGK